MLKNEKPPCRPAVVFRPFQQEDGASFRHCIEDFYGDGYPYKDYLNPVFLAEQCRRGRMVVLCGVTENSEVVSCSAVQFDTDFGQSAKLLLRVVKKTYRGMGIGAAQQKLLLQALLKRPQLQSVYADVMTHDTVSQASLAGEGFALCGLRLMLYFNSIMVPNLTFPAQSKMTQAVMCRNQGTTRVDGVYCPDEHRAIVESIYRRLGVTCQLLDTSPKPPMKTVYTWAEEPVHHARIAKVQAAGEDFGGLAEQWSKITRQSENTTILCYLNLKGHGAASAYTALRQVGFFFTGLKPLNENGEYMLLSHIGEQPILCDTIFLHEDGAGLLNYICTHKDADAIKEGRV